MLGVRGVGSILGVLLVSPLLALLCWEGDKFSLPVLLQLLLPEREPETLREALLSGVPTAAAHSPMEGVPAAAAHSIGDEMVEVDEG